MNSRKRPGCFILAACALGMALTLAIPGAAWADGAFFGGAEEPAQEAVILFHDSTEEMTLRVAYQGADGDFGWVVPLPSEPVIGEAGAGLFGYLYENYGHTASGYDVRKAGEDLGPVMGSGVEVVEERRVGIFDTTVLRASDPGELAAWLGERGYPYGPGQTELFRYYTDKGWCFAAFRVAPEAVEEREEGGEIPGTAYLQPLSFTFSTQQPVFPLKMSSGNPTGSLVRLYVIGDDTYRCDLAPERVTYALSPAELDGLEEYLPSLGAAMSGEGEAYLTVLERAFSREEMSDDLVFLPDASPAAQPEGLPFVKLVQDTTAGSTRRPGRFAVLLALAILVLSMAAIPILLRNRTQSSAWRLFTGLCATLVTMAVVATLAMAILYRQEQGRAGSSDWRSLGARQTAFYTRTVTLPGEDEAGGKETYIRMSMGYIMPDGSLEEAEPGWSYDGEMMVVSPDGRHIAMAGEGTITVFYVDENGSVDGRKDIGDDVLAYAAGGPSWSPASNRLAYMAYSGSPGGPYGRLMVLDTENGISREMESRDPMPQTICWSQDGGVLAVTRVMNPGTESASAETDMIDVSTGTVISTLVNPVSSEGSIIPLSFLITEDRLVYYRGLRESHQDLKDMGFELVLFDIKTGRELKSIKVEQPFRPILFKATGEGDLVFLGLGRSEESGGPVLKEFLIREGDLKVTEKIERALDWEAGEEGLLATINGYGLEMQHATLDERGRYLLIATSGNRTVLVDLVSGDMSVISGLNAGWAVAR